MALAVVLTLQAPPSQAQDAADARPALRSLSNAFTQVAQKAMPAVVLFRSKSALVVTNSNLAITTRSICLAKNS
jgi:hypothetical protein